MIATKAMRTRESISRAESCDRRGFFVFALCALVALVAAFAALVLSAPLSAAANAAEPTRVAKVAEAAHGMVATVHPLATEAGVSAMRDGGNAVDAAVAAALMLGVVDSSNSGIGGGCFILIRTADGKLVAIDGRETAPARIKPEHYQRDGKPDEEASLTGPLAVGTPGELAALALAVEKHGRKSLAELIAPAAELAAKGFPVSEDYADSLKETADDLARFPASKAALLKPDGSPYAQGEIIKQPDLARTYRAIAEHGPDWFYGGPFARTVGAWMADNGGVLSADDLAGYRAVVRPPVVTTYRGYTIVGFPPPSSGGVHVAQILNILENFDLAKLHDENPALVDHVTAEAMKLAFADRAYWLGDADFAKVPRGLVDKAYARDLAARIDPAKAQIVKGHGEPPGATSDFFGQRHTTHIAAADAEGNWVAITATINTTFGSKVIVPGTGVVLNNEMDDFAVHAGLPNVFGLVGGEANAVEPGKRPLSSMSPTIVLQDGRPVLTAGAAGGPTIISQVVLAIVRHIDLSMSVDEAVAAPRLHHQWIPDRVLVEEGFPAERETFLVKRGHKVTRTEDLGVTQAIWIGDDGRRLWGVADPRVEGKAGGF